MLIPRRLTPRIVSRQGGRQGLIYAGLHNAELGGDLSLTRATKKWYFDSDGVLQEAASGSPGFGPNGLTIDPQRTNLHIADAHRDFVNIWTGFATATKTQDQIGIDGAANSATTVEDDDAGAQEDILEDVTIPDDGTNYASTRYVLIDSNESRFPSLQHSIFGGTSVNNGISYNTKTGDTSVFAGSAGSHFLRVAPNANFREIDIRISNNSTGNTSIRTHHWPARKSTIDGGNDSTVTGSIVLDWETLVNALFVGHPIPGATTRNADVVAGTMPSRFGTGTDVISLDVTPFAESMGTFFVWATYVDASNYTAILHDGTNWIARRRQGGVNHDATIAHTYSAGTTYNIKARFGPSGQDIWRDDTKGSNDSNTSALQFDTAFQLGSDGNSANQGSVELKNLVMVNGVQYENDSAVVSL